MGHPGFCPDQERLRFGLPTLSPRNSRGDEDGAPGVLHSCEMLVDIRASHICQKRQSWGAGVLPWYGLWKLAGSELTASSLSAF